MAEALWLWGAEHSEDGDDVRGGASEFAHHLTGRHYDGGEQGAMVGAWNVDGADR